MIVGMWMTRNVVTAPPEMAIGAALALMVLRRIRRLPVVEGEATRPRLAGIVTESDIRRAYPADVNPCSVVAPDAPGLKTVLRDVMATAVATTTPDAPIEKAAAEMRDRRIAALPVLRERELVGLITESDIFRAFIAVLESPVRGARVTFDASGDEDVFSLVAECARRHGVRVLSLMSAQQHGKPVCVVRLAGASVDAMLDDLWASRHPMLNILHLP